MVIGEVRRGTVIGGGGAGPGSACPSATPAARASPRLAPALFTKSSTIRASRSSSARNNDPARERRSVAPPGAYFWKA
jgi:hypothetical protein